MDEERIRYKIFNNNSHEKQDLNEEEAIEFANTLIENINDHTITAAAAQHENDEDYDPEEDPDVELEDEANDIEDTIEFLEKHNFDVIKYIKPKHIHHSKYFCGIEIPEEEIKRGYISYRTLASAFEGVLCNEIISKTSEANIGYWQLVNGYEEDEEGNYKEIFQYIIIDNNGRSILEDYTDEIIFYNEELDLNVWGITHLGTAWSGVDTDIPIELPDKKGE